MSAKILVRLDSSERKIADKFAPEDSEVIDNSDFEKNLWGEIDLAIFDIETSVKDLWETEISNLCDEDGEEDWIWDNKDKFTFKLVGGDGFQSFETEVDWDIAERWFEELENYKQDEVFAAWLIYGGADSSGPEELTQFDDVEDFGRDRLEGLGEKLSSELEPFFDYEAYGESVLNNTQHEIINGTYYVGGLII